MEGGRLKGTSRVASAEQIVTNTPGERKIGHWLRCSTCNNIYRVVVILRDSDVKKKKIAMIRENLAGDLAKLK